MSRKGENIYKRKDGRWEGRVRVCVSGSKPKYRSVYAHSYSEVREKLRSLRVDELPGAASYNTFGYYTLQWLQSVKLRRKQSTCCKYYNICKNHVIPAFGEIKFINLRNDDISSLLFSKSDLSPKTLNDILCVIKMIYAYAEACGCKGKVCVKTLSVRVPNKQMRVLTINEQKTLSHYLLENSDLIKMGTYLVLCTGIRIGELCALRRENISFEDKLLHIGCTMQRVQLFDSDKKTEVIVTEPKSACSIRDIPITSMLEEVLREFCLRMPPDAFLLTGDRSKFIEPNVMRYHFKRQLKACGLENVRFHTLRHSFATRCVESGMDIKTLSEILGHENVNITLSRYVHSSLDFKRESMEKLCLSAAYLPSE